MAMKVVEMKLLVGNRTVTLKPKLASGFVNINGETKHITSENSLEIASKILETYAPEHSAVADYRVRLAQLLEAVGA